MDYVANIHTLPVEVLGHVLSWLDDEDLVQAASVSRHWFDVINQHLLRRKNRAILRPDASDFVPDWSLEKLSLIGFSSQQLANLGNVCADVTSLQISYQETTDRTLEDDHMAVLLAGCQQLKDVSFKNVTPAQSTLDVIERCVFASLQSLTFECQTKMDQEEIEAFFDKVHFPEVKLIIRSSENGVQSHVYARYPYTFNNPLSFIHVPVRATTLTLDCTGLSKHAYSCLRHCNNLHTIVLTNAFLMEDDAVETLCLLQRLTHVHISDASRVSAKGWSAMFRHRRPNLSSISLTRCETASADAVFTDIDVTNNLKLQLDLQNCKPITKLGLSSLLRAPQSLNLTLDYNEKLLDDLVETINKDNSIVDLHSLDIIIQRVQATSAANSLHLNNIQDKLASYSKQHGVHLNYRELFTKVVYNCRPISTSTYLD